MLKLDLLQNEKNCLYFAFQKKYYRILYLYMNPNTFSFGLHLNFFGNVEIGFAAKWKKFNVLCVKKNITEFCTFIWIQIHCCTIFHFEIWFAAKWKKNCTFFTFEKNTAEFCTFTWIQICCCSIFHLVCV